MTSRKAASGSWLAGMQVAGVARAGGVWGAVVKAYFGHRSPCNCSIRASDSSITHKAWAVGAPVPAPHNIRRPSHSDSW